MDSHQEGGTKFFGTSFLGRFQKKYYILMIIYFNTISPNIGEYCKNHQGISARATVYMKKSQQQRLKKHLFAIHLNC